MVLPLRECASLFRRFRERDHKEAIQSVILLTIKCSGSLKFHIPGFNPSSILVRESSGSFRFCQDFPQDFKAWQHVAFSGLFFDTRGLKANKGLCSSIKCQWSFARCKISQKSRSTHNQPCCRLLRNFHKKGQKIGAPAAGLSHSKKPQLFVRKYKVQK